MWTDVPMQYEISLPGTGIPRTTATPPSSPIVQVNNTAISSRSLASGNVSTPLTPGVESTVRRDSVNNAHNSHGIFCPVAGCPKASPQNKRPFRDFASIKNHLNDHCTGQISGAVPGTFLANHSYSQCTICDKILHTKYHGTCPKCRPRARARSQMDTMRSRANTMGSNSSSLQHQPTSMQEPRTLPTLSDVSEQWVPTIRNVPFVLRRL